MPTKQIGLMQNTSEVLYEKTTQRIPMLNLIKVKFKVKFKKQRTTTYNGDNKNENI